MEELKVQSSLAETKPTDNRNRSGTLLDGTGRNLGEFSGINPERVRIQTERDRIQTQRLNTYPEGGQNPWKHFGMRTKTTFGHSSLQNEPFLKRDTRFFARKRVEKKIEDGPAKPNANLVII